MRSFDRPLGPTQGEPCAFVTGSTRPGLGGPAQMASDGSWHYLQSSMQAFAAAQVGRNRNPRASLFGARKWLKELSQTDPWEWSLVSAADTSNVVTDSCTFI